MGRETSLMVNITLFNSKFILFTKMNLVPRIETTAPFNLAPYLWKSIGEFLEQKHDDFLVGFYYVTVNSESLVVNLTICRDYVFVRGENGAEMEMNFVYFVITISQDWRRNKAEPVGVLSENIISCYIAELSNNYLSWVIWINFYILIWKLYFHVFPFLL